MIGSFVVFLKRELVLIMRQKQEYINALAFNALVILLFVLGFGSDAELLSQIAVSLIWVSALLSQLLLLNKVFYSDYAQGVLEQLFIYSDQGYILVFAKIIAYWLATTVPLLLLTPWVAISLSMSLDVLFVLLLSLLIGGLCLSLLGALGAALSLHLKQSSLTVALIIMPFYLPVLLLALMATRASEYQLDALPYLGLLLALMFFLLSWIPFLCAKVLAINIGS